MKNVERRDRQLPYISDAEVMEQQMNARRLTQKLNTIDRSDFDGIAAIVKELFGKSAGAFVNPPFYCDYGFHIEVGKNFFATINEQISNFAQTYPTNLKASSNEALLFMRRYRFANCSCFSCCFKDAYPSSNVQ